MNLRKKITTFPSLLGKVTVPKLLIVREKVMTNDPSSANTQFNNENQDQMYSNNNSSKPLQKKIYNWYK